MVVNPDKMLQQISEDKVEAFCGTVKPDGTYRDPVYQSVQSTAKQIGEEYGTRFLVELIQNAYDAHRSNDRDGEIQVLLSEEEGDNGTLYVANRGRPFTLKNVEALCNVGLSDKRIGQTIGNKGLGFRSVRLITEDPQIYSRHPFQQDGNFGGYCFRFAKEEDFDALIDSDTVRELAKRDTPPFWIPVPLANRPHRVTSFAQDGFSTVVRLPLRSSSALNIALEEAERLRDSKVPLLLFLDRLKRLTFTVEGDAARTFSLNRQEEWSVDIKPGSSDQVSYVGLGPLGEYLLVRRSVDEDIILGHIQQSIDAGRLDVDWLNWTGSGEVALALRMDQYLANGRFYTYLPMGPEAKAPFPGHLHATFFTKVDRRTVDLSVPLNQFLLENALLLSAHAIQALRGMQEFPLDAQFVRCAVADLLSWRDTELCQGIAQRLVEVFEQSGSPLAELDVMPVLAGEDGHGWALPPDVRMWDRDDLEYIDAERVIEVGFPVLDPKLGSPRLARLEYVLDDWGYDSEPSGREMAELAERVAGDLHKARRTPKSTWRDFYSDLQILFFTEADALSGRKILLCADGKLRKAVRRSEQPSSRESSGRTQTVFFPPKRTLGDEGDEIIHVPKKLQRGLAFVEDLGWYDELSESRSMFESGKLVAPYDADSLIAQVSRRVQSTRSEAIRLQGLRWVFRLYAGSRKTARPISLRSARLFVPTSTDRWVPASSAIFSSGWPEDTLGDITTELLQLASPYDPELEELSNVLIAAPDHEAFKGDIGLWTDFLRQVGVESGLSFRIVASQQTKVKARQIRADRLSHRFELSPATAALWRTEANVSADTPQRYLDSYHTIDEDLVLMQGQETFEDWPERARVLFAVLLLHVVKESERFDYDVTFYHPSFKYDSRISFPTPFAAFVRCAEWFPVQPVGDPGAAPIFERLDRVWLPGEDDALPIYMPRASRAVRHLMQQTNSIVRKLHDFGRANVWTLAESDPQKVADLARIVGEGRTNSYHLPAIINDYRDAWKTVLRSGEKPAWPTSGRYLLVSRGDRYEAVDLDSDSEEPIYVQDSLDTFVPSLLSSLGYRVFTLDAPISRDAVDILKEAAGGRIRTILDVDLTVDGEGEAIEAHESTRLVDEIPAVNALLLLAAESIPGIAAQSIPRDRSKLIEALRTVRLITTRRLGVSIDGEPAPLPAAHRGTLGLTVRDTPTIVIETAGPLSWEHVHRMAQPICSVIRYPILEQPFKLAVRSMEGLKWSPSKKAYDVAIQHVAIELGLDEIAVRAALSALKGDPGARWRMLEVLAHYFGGDQGLETLQDSWDETMDGAELVFGSMVPESFDSGTVVDIAYDAVSYEELFRELDLDLARLNNSLAKVGEKELTNEEVHKQLLRHFIDLNRDAILDRLRQPFTSVFRKYGDLSEYVSSRDSLDGIEPRAEWKTSVWEPSRDDLKERINSWLVEKRVPTLDHSESGLPPAREARKQNASLVEDFLTTAVRIVVGWCNKTNTPPPPAWEAASQNPPAFLDQLNELGFLDFEVLGESYLIALGAKILGWPKGMPATLDVNTLGLSPTELDNEIRREREAKEERDRKRRSVQFGNDILDPNDADRRLLRNVFNNIDAIVSSSESLPAFDQITNLRSMGASAKAAGSRGSGGGRRRRVDSRAAELIGFLGECAVYHWLRGQYPGLSIDDSWKSEQRNKILAGKGNDSLGYDFRLVLPDRTLYLEVKGHLDDPSEIELGESEVRQARDCANNDSDEYRIIYVYNISSPDAIGIDILPNPLGLQAGSVYRMAGEGLRFRFRRG